jgi:hypothetical protein
MIEVWEKLDCESVGAAEIKAIETVVEDRFGKAAVDSPMKIARLLADEGAVLRHSEVMELFVERNKATAYDAVVWNIFDLTDLPRALTTIRKLENARRKFASENDNDGIRMLREAAIGERRELTKKIEGRKENDVTTAVSVEIDNWLSVWLQTPEVFNDWVELRQRSEDYKRKFGQTSQN